MKKAPGKNEFFDINKLPNEWGIWMFPISMSRITTSQDPVSCIKYIQTFSPSKISVSKYGLNFIYGDFLYLYSKEKAYTLKDRFMHLVIHHKNALKKLLLKNRESFQIQHAFSFQTWNQFYLSMDDFDFRFRKLKDIFKKDKKFQKYLKEDAKVFGKKLDENQINFFLEEHLIFYLISKGKAVLQNEYVDHREQWILWCYPGNPPKGLVYLHQLNPFKLNNLKNPYQDAQYNLETKKLIKYDHVDLETYSVK